MNSNKHEDPGQPLESRCNRRTVLLGAGKAAAVGVTTGLVAAAPDTAQSAESKAGQQCMTIIYENGPDVRFDFEYYKSTHMPRIMEAYGGSISRFELRRGLPGADGAAPLYIATITIWIADPEAFDAAAAVHQAGLRADVPKFTNAKLLAQRDEIVKITDG